MPFQAGELACAAVELLLLAAAAMLLWHPGQDTGAMANTMVACYFLDLALLIIPEALRWGGIVLAWLRQPRRHGDHGGSNVQRWGR